MNNLDLLEKNQELLNGKLQSLQNNFFGYYLNHI